ncbi:DUF2161 family putative PD-(D/E)XK-type phosphodiesterase [Chakrabartyella piscis]|uniref:DUF2161 family putative PD-(D/E)XK-type phosphodiesterase n=1 Tax=Chakrabartyella piscis TaxID=2918914 RepID=UPI002958C981|nr:DUF2161 family putative PD-(D/E)XK-type phosphodiesterase [Chakrabartyella piscis]
MSVKEADLFDPIRLFLEDLGYAVQGEVKDCDIVATRESETIIVELKRSFNLKLVYQAIERQTIAEHVYVAIPRPQKGQRDRTFKDMVRLLKRLELGLLTVALDSPVQLVEVVLEPADSVVRKNRRKQEGLAKEVDQRLVAINKGGINKTKIMTAYREKSLALCCYLETKESATVKELRELDAKYPSLVQSNPYKWYRRVEKGVYTLSEEGKLALEEATHQKIVKWYRDNLSIG